MITYIVRRLLSAVVLVAVVSMITFATFFLVPRLAGQNSYQLAAQYVGRNPTAEAVHQVEAKFGFDRPLPEQYGRFMLRIVTGEHYSDGPLTIYCPPPCFGYSYRTQLQVWPQLTSALPVTVSLAIGSAVLWLAAGVGAGVISALRRGSIFDRLSMGAAVAAVSLPIFFTGPLLLALFSYKWPLFPNVHYVPFTQNPLAWARNLVLPWIVLTFLHAALYARLSRSSMLEVMGEDYIRTARAKGLPERRVYLKHGLRAALTPVVTIFGMDLGLLIGGAVVTEVTFSMQGLGMLTFKAIQNQDFPPIMGVVLLASFFVVVANLFVDVLYAVLDPRVRY